MAGATRTGAISPILFSPTGAAASSPVPAHESVDLDKRTATAAARAVATTPLGSPKPRTYSVLNTIAHVFIRIFSVFVAVFLVSRGLSGPTSFFRTSAAVTPTSTATSFSQASAAVIPTSIGGLKGAKNLAEYKTELKRLCDEGVVLAKTLPLARKADDEAAIFTQITRDFVEGSGELKINGEVYRPASAQDLLDKLVESGMSRGEALFTMQELHQGNGSQLIHHAQEQCANSVLGEVVCGGVGGHVGGGGFAVELELSNGKRQISFKTQGQLSASAMVPSTSPRRIGQMESVVVALGKVDGTVVINLLAYTVTSSFCVVGVNS